jgi:ubiquinone/menaquinone biosynthesis C-methylase UbiE
MEIALDRFSGFSSLYNKVRPQPPSRICKLIMAFYDQSMFDLVIDLGSGTGLSTSIWKDFSKKVIGVEPNSEMRAEAQSAHKGIEFLEGSSYSIPIESNSVDMVCCSQSFHWMEPAPTLREINRVLKPGGLLVVYDCFWPITINPVAEMAYMELFKHVNDLTAKYRTILPRETKWPKHKHKENIENSGYFSYIKTSYIDNEEKCDAARYIGIAYSQGHLQTLIKNKVSEIDKYLTEYEDIINDTIRKVKTMWVSYEVIIAQKTLS